MKKLFLVSFLCIVIVKILGCFGLLFFWREQVTASEIPSEPQTCLGLSKYFAPSYSREELPSSKANFLVSLTLEFDIIRNLFEKIFIPNIKFRFVFYKLSHIIFCFFKVNSFYSFLK